MKYAIVTFGCRVNQADSFVIEEQLRERGATSASVDAADLVVVNTCSVTATADQGARQTIRRVARQNPAARIVVTGCYATRRPAELEALPNVLRVVPNPQKDGLVDRLGNLCPELTSAERYGDGDGPCGALVPGVAGRTALTLRVQTGCDERCTYCIIPRTRGTGRSKPLIEVLAAVDRAEHAGYKEIAIAGVHLGSYGRDLRDGSSLVKLVAALAEWPGDVLFRVSSLEPMDCSPEIVGLVAASPRLAPHFHLPLQHGSDRVLRAMRRPYTASAYQRLVEHIRERIPAASIGTDLIAGFPGEEPSDVELSMALLDRLPLTHFHVFPYSDRPGTEAAARPGKVAGPDIRARAQELRAIGAEKSRQFQRTQLGAVRRGLTVDDGSHVVTDNYLRVRIPSGVARNEWVQVTIGGAPGALEGELTSARSL